MPVRAVDDKSSDTLVVVSGEGFWTGSSTLPHLHHFFAPVTVDVSAGYGFGEWCQVQSASGWCQIMDASDPGLAKAMLGHELAYVQSVPRRLFCFR
jgi:hypothetical protein